MPKSELLLDYCLRAISYNKASGYYDHDNLLVAAELLGIHFAGDKDVSA